MKIDLCILLTAASAYSQVPFTREYIFVAPTWQTAEGSAANYYGAGFGRERVLGARIGVGMEPPSPPWKVMLLTPLCNATPAPNRAAMPP